MKKLFLLIAICYVTLAQAQNTRNDSYSAFGLLTSFEQIPFGIGFYNAPLNENYGFFTELKFNRLSFNDDYNFVGFPVASDTLRNALFLGNNNLLKMINIGTVINPQEFGLMRWDFIDIDFCVGIGYVQNFRYKFYNDTQGIEAGDGQSPSNPLGKYYVIDYNDHGINLNLGTNLSFQRVPFMIHIGYDLKPKVFALGFNWKIK
tara:strand:- start:163 stop:774 length:612 start_codon:yes stop_codon:yes gene_type:complete